ncbi:MAG: transglycosylase domain-containing protein, partial [Chloroflexota bacterium]|nr:transglycosylase domain-containing protein [Chloroflexota bacterium]
AGATMQNLREGELTSGASTITMQLARNLFLGPDQRYAASAGRKLFEVGLAQELTNRHSKDELLEMYLNLLNYGNLAYGPEAAAQTYFGKSAADLTLAEATLLAGIPQQPANLDPFTKFDAVKQRQRIVLDLLVRHGQLTATTADEVYAAEITLLPKPTYAPNLTPHFVQYVIETLDARHGAGYTQRAGLNIYTTLDLRMQTLAQQVVTTAVAELQPKHDLSNAALVAMRPNSGEILAMVGSADFNNAAIAGQVNVAVRLRQPGSAIKPVLYATAFNDNLISPATVLWDVPVTYTISAEQTYRPQNYDNKFHGAVTVRTALANSYNVPTVKLLDGLGIGRMLQSARAMGVQSLSQPSEWYGLSLTLGGGDVTLLDLTTAYHTLASNGEYLAANPFLALTDSQNQPLVWEVAQPAPVIAPEAAFLVTDILNDNTARTPAFGADSQLKLSRPAAAKTGTTTDFRDNWTVGYTRYLVAGVWAGNSDGRPMRNLSGIIGAAPVWHRFMEGVLADPALLAVLDAPADPATWEFTPPPGVAKRPECPPGVTCRTGGEYFTTTWITTAGGAGPLVDSVEVVATAPVYAQQGGQSRSAGFCELENAAARTVLKLPSGLGLPTVPSATGVTTDTATITETLTLTTAVRLSRVAQEQSQVIAWSMRYPTGVNLGPCARLNEVVKQALTANPGPNDAGLRFFVDTAAAANPLIGDAANTVAVLTTTQAVDNPIPLVGGSYMLAKPVVNDTNCPGAYVMGRIVNRDGGPVAGVYVYLRDEWGNYAYAVSKSGATDYGLFDLPIASSAPHELYLTVMDGGGNPISPTFTILHKLGEAGDASCHHVVFQGG